MSSLKLEMTSYSDCYDVTNFCCFENFLGHTLFLPSFIVVKPQIAELNWGDFLPLILNGIISDPVQNRFIVLNSCLTYRSLQGDPWSAAPVDISPEPVEEFSKVEWRFEASKDSA